MKLVEIPTPKPGPKAALVRIAASGVNFIDVYFRNGLYKADLPIRAWAAKPRGRWKPSVLRLRKSLRAIASHTRWCEASYAEYAVVPASQLVRIPDGVDFESAAAAMLQGMTAHYLTHSTYAVQPGDDRVWCTPRPAARAG